MDKAEAKAPDFLNRAREQELEQDIEKVLAQKMEAAAAELNKPLPFNKKEPETPAPIDMQRLMTAGAKLLKSKIDEHITTVSLYDKTRAGIVDGYRVRLERLQLEAEEYLRELDATHKEKLEGIERMIAKLKALRDT